jgi:hypothetical protein
MEQKDLASDEATFLNRPVWGIVLLGLLAWQSWMTLRLFGPEQAWLRLIDDQPILSGRHPLHLYHGMLGASSLLERFILSSYDPAFLAGYPKTPVFDSGCRPAEVFLTIAGGGYRPAAYKIGLAVCCCLVPLLFATTARGMGLGPGMACLASAVGMLVWWGAPCREMLEAGDLDLLLAVLAALVHVGLLLQFHRRASLAAWAGLLATGCLGWFAQPLLFTLLLIPLLLVYYHGVGVRHHFGWHLALLAGLAGGVAVNSFWLVDWVAYWWLRVPLPIGQRLLTHRTLQTFWESPVWGEPTDRALALVVFASGFCGIALYAMSRARVTARLLFLGMIGLLLLALIGTAWEPLGRIGAPRLLVPALWFAVPPAVYAWHWTWSRLGIWTGSAWRGALLGGMLLFSAGWFLRSDLETLARRSVDTAPLIIGLSSEQHSLIEALQTHTATDARILWEDRRLPSNAPRWTALLPLWTGRAFLGGLDPEANLEHGYASLVEEQLAGRPIDDWTNAELETFFRRYNVGWVIGRLPATVACLDACCSAGAAERTASLMIDGQPSYLYTLRRSRSFVLKGQADWLQANSRHIVLGDVLPEDGKVVLSLHYQAGMQVSPHTIQVEREPDALDPIPLIRLRITCPLTRVILSWPAN